MRVFGPPGRRAAIRPAIPLVRAAKRPRGGRSRGLPRAWTRRGAKSATWLLGVLGECPSGYERYPCAGGATILRLSTDGCLQEDAVSIRSLGEQRRRNGIERQLRPTLPARTRLPRHRARVHVHKARGWQALGVFASETRWIGLDVRDGQGKLEHQGRSGHAGGSEKFRPPALDGIGHAGHRLDNHNPQGGPLCDFRRRLGHSSCDGVHSE